MTARENAYVLIEEYSDQAYYRSLEYAVVAMEIGDRVGAALFTSAAIELLEMGYNQYPRKREEIAARYENDCVRDSRGEIDPVGG